MTAATDPDVRHLGIVLFDGVEELDAVGPWEVLSSWTRTHPEDGFAVHCLSRDGGSVQCAKGLTVAAHHSFADAPEHEVLVYPGGRGTRAHLQDAEQLAWVRAQRARVPLMTSVCTGSLVYAAAGLLAGRPATTHWGTLDLLRQLDPTIDVREQERFVDDGDASRPRGCRPASTWPCTSSSGSPGPSAPARCAAASSTTRSRRSDRPAPVS